MGDASQDTTSQRRYYRLRQLKARFNVSGSAIWSWAKNGTFPQPIKLSENTTVWLGAEIEDWERSRIEARVKKGTVSGPGKLHENDTERTNERPSVGQEPGRA